MKRWSFVLMSAMCLGLLVSTPEVQASKDPDKVGESKILKKSGEIRGMVNFCGLQGNTGTVLHLAGKNFSVQTDATGAFQFFYVPEGFHTLVIEVSGEVPVTQTVEVMKRRITQLGTIQLCPDNDNDGFAVDVDCNDNNPSVNPGAIEACDGFDNNCDMVVDEGCVICTDADNDGFFAQTGCGTPVDCQDGDTTIFPGATEICNGQDDNCDGGVDEGLDLDSDGFTTCGGDCNDGDSTINPDETETCDGVDNNCDGNVDEGFDFDEDGFTTCGGDCNDGDNMINPDATETCDGIDNNCDGTIDENDVCVSSVCGNGIIESGEACDGGACCSASCAIQPSGFFCRAEAGACDIAETCDGIVASCPSDFVNPVGSNPGGVCTPYLCDGDVSCPMSCQSDFDCVGTHYCDDNSCAVLKAGGDSCGGDNECQSGNCLPLVNVCE